MKKFIGKKREREKSCFFPEKLFKILQSKNKKSLLHWDKEGKVIEIENKFEFSKISNKYFKCQNYDSFIRQLNLYGFEKLINIQKSDKERFALENFTKDSSIEDIRKIKRKKINNKNNNDNMNNNIFIKENNEKIKEILNQIEKEKDDYIIIKKYKSIINDKEINLNEKFVINVMKYINNKKQELKESTNKIKKEIKKIKFESIASNFDINNKIDLDINKNNIYESKILLNDNNNNNKSLLEYKKPIFLSKSFNKEMNKEQPDQSFNKFVLNNFNNKESLKFSFFSSNSETPECFKKSVNSEIKFL